MAEKDNLQDVKSPIIMKVDAPADENTSNIATIDENNKSYEKQFFNENVQPKNSFASKAINQTSKLPVLAKPKFGAGNPFALKSSILSSSKLNSDISSPKPILRPSKLAPATATASEQTDNPFTVLPTVKVNNPFFKVDKDESKEKDKNNTASSSSAEPPMFVPLSGDSAPSVPSNTSSSSSTHTNSLSATSFVFGQNLRERVTGEQVEGNGIEENDTTSVASCSSNGTSSDTLFAAAAACDTFKPQDNNDSTKSLSEAAREYEESRAQKRKYEEVTVITGEENEDNIMQIGCKLFAFDQVTKNWQERGRGNLRLNDIVPEGDTNSEYRQSRLVVRAAGSLRVVLNTKIWAGMSVEMPSSKSIRLTAMDSAGVVKVFLVMANIKEIEKLFILLKNRVDMEVKRQKEDPETQNKRKASEVPSEENE